MAFQNKTWEMTIKVKVTTMSGWEPYREDIEGWLEDGDVLELVSVMKVEETK